MTIWAILLVANFQTIPQKVKPNLTTRGIRNVAIIGSYNIAPPDWIYTTDVARETGRRTIKVPLWLMKLASRICWGLRIPFLRYPPGVNFYIRYPWVVAPRRLCDELGFRFRYSSVETLREVLRSHGKLASTKPNLDDPDSAYSEQHRAA